MKKIVSLFVIVFAFQTALFAQQLTDDVIFNAHLLDTYNIVVTEGGTQEITFQTADDYNLGVTGPAINGIDPGYSVFTVEATGNWDVTLHCPDFTPGGANPGAGSIPINNLGVYCTATGNYQFDAEVACAFQNAAAAMGLSNAPGAELITNLSGNAGTSLDNEYRLDWLMGTMQGGMNGTSMLVQMTAGTFTTGDYTTTAILTLIPE